MGHPHINFSSWDISSSTSYRRRGVRGTVGDMIQPSIHDEILITNPLVPH